KAFAKVRKLVAPPRQPAADRKKLSQRVKTLGEQVNRARANLVLLDADNIPAAQEKIRELDEERQALETELRKRPPQQADVNAEALEVLRSLYWLSVLFRSAAESVAIGDEMEARLEAGWEGAWFSGADKSAALRRFLRKIAGITCNTRIEGH